MSDPTTSDSAIASGVALVIVTYKRADLLRGLLESLTRSKVWPEHLILVDNADEPEVAQLLAEMAQSLPGIRLHFLGQEENLGGAGGFAAGIDKAHALGAEWIWVMDDDVEILPDGLGELIARSSGYGLILGRRYDADGQPFFWQQRFNAWLGFPVSVPGDPFLDTKAWPTNCGCFEGMFIHRNVIDKIGLPDPAFFLTWDDTIYGWLASQHFDMAYVDAFTLQKVRRQASISLGFRHLNDASDLSRFHAMKNRALVRHYLIEQDAYRPIGFALGGALNFGKELFRLVAVERSLSGFGSLLHGMREARRLDRELAKKRRS